MVVSWGVYTAFGVFFKPLTEFGWTSTMISGAFSLSMIVYGVLGIVMGNLNDRYGPRVVTALCGFLLGLGYLLMSQVSALWELYLFFGVIVGIGMSGAWVPLLSSVARWFVTRRSLMTGIVITGFGIGQVLGPPVVDRLISTYGLRLSYIILGGVILLVIGVAAQFMRRDPIQMGQMPYDANVSQQQGIKPDNSEFTLNEAVHTAQFWLVFIILFSEGFGLFTIIVHLVSYAIMLNISTASAASLLAASGGMGILGNYMLGAVADKFGNRYVCIICFLIMMAALLLLVPARELWMLYLFAIIFGFSTGGIAAVESPLVARLFGMSAHGLIYGVVHLGFTAGAMVGPVLTGYIFDVTGSYKWAFLICAAVGFLGFILSVILRPTRMLSGRI
jgi:MFS family permease